MTLASLMRLSLRHSIFEACGFTPAQAAERIESDHALALAEDADRDRSSRIHAQAVANSKSDEIFWKRGLS